MIDAVKPDEKIIEAAAKVSTMPQFSAVESPLILAICQAYESARQQPSRDALVNDSAFQAAIASLGPVDDEFNQWFLDEGNLRAFVAVYLRQQPQVSVEVCARALHKWASKGAISWETEDQEFYRMAAKSVLDAAGVKYG